MSYILYGVCGFVESAIFLFLYFIDGTGRRLLAFFYAELFKRRKKKRTNA